jgi:putative ABC transport system permease protein
MWQDVRIGLRSLIKVPVFTATVVLTLALGIGANAAVFTIVNLLLLKPLPVRDPGNLYVLAVTHEGNEDPHNVSWPDLQDYRTRSGVFEDVAAYDFAFVGLSAERRAERITISYVSNNLFSMLGVAAGIGRVIQPSDDPAPGANPILVLGYSYWLHRFNGDPSVVGRSVLVNGQPFTIAGIVPKSFHGPYALVEFDGYVPMSMEQAAAYRDRLTKRDNHSCHALARLKPGVTLAQAQAAISVTARQLEQQYPDTNKTVRARLIPERLARPEANGAGKIPLVAAVFVTLVGLVLMVACVNVINLILVRSTTRQRELAVRAALGAGRRRLVRQLLTESVLLAAGGGLAGAALGRWCAALLASIRLPGDLPFRFDLSFDWRVFAYIAAIALTVGIAVGLLPALRASRADLNQALREGGRGASDGRSRQRLRGALVVAQVAVSLVLLIAAGLFVRSMTRAQSIDLGFDPAHVLNVSIDVAQKGYDEARGRALYDELLRRVATLPGVDVASLSYSVPLSYYNSSAYIEVEGHPTPSQRRKPFAGTNSVTPEYLRTMKLRLLRGRFFTESDDARAPRVAVINQTMARKFWPGEDPIGRRIRSTDIDHDAWLTVVGIVADGRFTFIFDDPSAYFFVPLAQHYESLRVLQLRTAGDPAVLVPLVRRAIHDLDADLPIYDVVPMSEVVQGPNGFFLLRMGALFGGGLGLLGLTLALVGVYGVVSYAASQRTQEIGVRMALGAQRGDVIRLVLGRGLLLVAIGIAVGVSSAAAAARVISGLLFGISALDPLTFGVVPLLLATMALAASYLPAFKATRVDPCIALRGE